MPIALPPIAVVKRRSWVWAAAILRSLASASAEEHKTYWDLATFQELSALVPELSGARPRGLAPGGMELWMQNQFRLPETPSTVLRGEFRQPGRVDCAVLLEVGEPEKARTYLLIATRDGKRWVRLFMGAMEERGDLLWDEEKHVLLLDTGERHRRTRPATMTWEPGRQTAQFGYVLEDWQVVPYTWEAAASRFHRGDPYWLEKN
jgi:hypothetical protein